MLQRLTRYRPHGAALGTLTCIALMSACSPSADNSDTPPPVSLKDFGPPTTDMDSGDDMDPVDASDLGRDATMTDDGSDDGGGESVKGICANVQDLGVLDSTTMNSITLEGSTIKTTVLNEFVTSCGEGTAPEVGWKFTVTDPVEIHSNILNAGIRWALELHQGSCAQPSLRFCDADLETDFVVPPGDYILLAEPLVNMRGVIKAQLDITPLACFPLGSRTCSADAAHVDICTDNGMAITQRSCIAPCAQDACGGDLCTNAIVVDTLPYTFTGPVEGYEDRINFDAENTCRNSSTTPEPGAGRFKTPGQDVTFIVKGLTQGQRLFVDASDEVGDEADSVIFVLDTCDKMTCHVAVDLEDKIAGWEVPEDGDYTVIVDRSSDSSADLGVSIHVE